MKRAIYCGACLETHGVPAEPTVTDGLVVTDLSRLACGSPIQSRWSLTHVRSGASLTHSYDRDEMHDVAGKVGTLNVDWTGSGVDVKADVDRLSVMERSGLRSVMRTTMQRDVSTEERRKAMTR